MYKQDGEGWDGEEVYKQDGRGGNGKSKEVCKQNRGSAIK